MFKIIEKYQTADGVEHTSEQLARKHVERAACDSLLAIVKQSAPDIKHAQAVAIAWALWSDRVTLGDVLTLANFGDDGRDDNAGYPGEWGI